jgi:hypothetical protein
MSIAAAIFLKVPVRGLEPDFYSLAKAGWVIFACCAKSKSPTLRSSMTQQAPPPADTPQRHPSLKKNFESGFSVSEQY